MTHKFSSDVLRDFVTDFNRFLNSQNIYLCHGKLKNNGPFFFIKNRFIRALKLYCVRVILFSSHIVKMYLKSAFKVSILKLLFITSLESRCTVRENDVYSNAGCGRLIHHTFP